MSAAKARATASTRWGGHGCQRGTQGLSGAIDVRNDFGETQLECGRADVTIDPNFAALADTANYHVFLTAYGGDHQLHVAHRTAKGFTVVADLALAAMKGKQSSELSGSFSWRIVAKRKDIEGPRLERVTVPPEPVLPSTEHPRSEVEPRR